MATTLHTEELPKGSVMLRGYYGLKDFGDNIDLVGVIINEGSGVGVISGLHGQLTNEMMVQIGSKAWSLGFKTLKFHRTKGGKAARWGRFTHDDDHFDYYIIDDLAAEITRYSLHNRIW